MNETYRNICNICGQDRNADGGFGHSVPITVWSPASFEPEFTISIANCFAGWPPPNSLSTDFLIRDFIVEHNLSALYAILQTAETNVPATFSLDGEMIVINTDILGLEEMFITHYPVEMAREIPGYHYAIVPNRELFEEMLAW